jgi:hypothetical protein
LALSGLALYGCGDDDTPEASDAAVVREAGAVSDAATKADAGSASDASSAQDAATRDGGGMDAATTNDSGQAKNDAGRLDSAVPDAAAKDGAAPAPDTGTSQGPAPDASVIPASGDPRSAACLACEMTECNMAKWPNADGISFKTCSDFMNETAEDGPSMGMARRQLCENLLTCVRNTRCADIPLAQVPDGGETFKDGLRCLAGPMLNSQDLLFTDIDDIADLKGPCLTTIAPAAETLDVAEILERWVNPDFPLGAVFNRVNCQQFVCADECYAPCAGKPDGTACSADAPVAPAGTCSMNRCTDDTSVVNPQ